MFGTGAGIENKELFFANSARRFALDAKMFRCRAAIHVENKDDIIFWSTVIKHFRPDDRFHFIAGSRNEFGHETSGVTQCLKYLNYLSTDFFICIDSDYRYLLHEKEIDVKHYVLQTYTYSFENHHCFAEGLDEVCSRVTHVPNQIFSFRRFLAEYSRIVYPLFIWHLYFLGADPTRFSKYEFNQFINLGKHKAPDILNNVGKALEELRYKVKKKTDYFERIYPQADLAFIRNKYEILGLTSDTTYLFIRGHNVYDMISSISKEVCKILLKKARRGHHTREAIAALYRDRNNVDMELRQNIHYGAYTAIQKLEKDIYELLGNVEVPFPRQEMKKRLPCPGNNV
ncbi:DUF4435 domain-containing protein [uncultured Odoribacter sp.]|uniref:DUF4435 domain-containing protein n=1 Tax=uncultured Odoribacter sp. TaxID=876416 RepID=UPI00261EE4A0|nr:DUF4435 domain-containing protein [uncultured Odoribacter sp.]